MAGENQMEKLNEAMEKTRISASIKKFQGHDLLCYEQQASIKSVNLSDSLPSLTSMGDAFSVNQEHTNQGQVSSGVYCPPISTSDYLFAGRAGVYSRLDRQGYSASHQGFKPPHAVYHPAGKVPSFNNQGRGQFFQETGIRNFWLDSRKVDRYKMGERCNRSRSSDFSSELTRGPRANRREGSSNLSKIKDYLMRTDKCSNQTFQIKYDDARFFMIKSYSEADIHKSIKYNVWSSTPHGNKKLDAAFREAEAKANEASKCPIFLFFSVNSSGQFVGLAEMIGPVDFNKSMNFWQQDKWHGFFPVKWHIIKDIPNCLFRNIILENNDNRTVTYSRDTQEIGLPQGLKMLQIFKDFQEEMSILDDFGFYEENEKALHARRSTTIGHPKGEAINNNNSLKLSKTAIMVWSGGSDITPGNQKASLVSLGQ